MNDPISQQNSVKGLIAFGEQAEKWRAQVKENERQLLYRMANGLGEFAPLGYPGCERPKKNS